MIDPGPPPAATSARVSAGALCAVWAELLGRERVAPGERLRELGADPYQVVRFMVEVETELGARAPLAPFFDGEATVDDLAPMLSGGETPLVVPVRAAGQAAPLFFVHGDEWAMLSLRSFPGPLGPDRPLFGLLPRRDGRRFDRGRPMEDLAIDLCEAVRATQPAGPYHLGGHSLGGVLAYEIAGRLLAAGEEVAWLGLADTLTPAALDAWHRAQMAFRSRLRRQIERGIAGAPAKAAAVAGRALRSRLRRARAAAGATIQPEAVFDWETAQHLYRRCRVSGHGGRLDVFTTAVGVEMSKSRSLGWAEVHRGPLALHPIPGDHLTMLEEPHVTTLARAMAASLDAAGREAG